MACEVNYAFHGRVLPYNDLIERVSVCGYKLINVLAEKEVADLRTSVVVVQLLIIECIPKANCAIGGAPT